MCSFQWSGYGLCTGGYVVTSINDDGLGVNIGSPNLFMSVYPNPATDHIGIRYHVAGPMKVTIKIYDSLGKLVAIPVKSQQQAAGNYTWQLFHRKSGG
jgi:hypothetical protein